VLTALELQIACWFCDIAKACQKLNVVFERSGLESMWIVSGSAEKDLRVLIDKLEIDQQHDFEVVKAEHILGCIDRLVSSRLSCSAIARL